MRMMRARLKIGRPAAAPAPLGANGAESELAPGGGAPVRPVDLLARRERLALELAELQWDIGGLAYEMAIRDHFRVDVLVRVAARLQEVDSALGEVERLIRMEGSGAAGSCPACGALHGRGASFCWQCGAELLQPVTPGARP